MEILPNLCVFSQKNLYRSSLKIESNAQPCQVSNLNFMDLLEWLAVVSGSQILDPNWDTQENQLITEFRDSTSLDVHVYTFCSICVNGGCDRK